MNGVHVGSAPSQWQDYIAAPGTANATRARELFISQIHTIAGGADNVRLLWLPKNTDTTTTTSEEKDARVFTYDATIASRISALGSGVAVSFDGTDDEADVPDADDFSLGDSLTDMPFSVMGLVNQTASATFKTILSKHDLTTGAQKREWRFALNSTEQVYFECVDESASATIARYYNTVLASSAWMLLTATYDGSRASSGIALYYNVARVDDTSEDVGTYVAMENGASLVRLGFAQGAAAGVQFFSGSMAFVALIARQVQQDEVMAAAKACNAYFNLALV